MSTPNGVSSPTRRPETPAVTSGKRKRADSGEDLCDSLIDVSHPVGPEPQCKDLSTFFENVYPILQSQDTTPSILNYPLPALQVGSALCEPSTKRSKLSDASDQTTIALRLASKTYYAVVDLIDDVDRVSKLICAALAPEDCLAVNGSIHTRQPPPTAQSRHAIERVLAFKQLLSDLVLREALHASRSIGQGTLGAANPGNEEPVSNGVSKEVSVVADPVHSRGRTVLTLYGSAPTPKQLFSGLQRQVNPSFHTSSDAADLLTPLLQPLSKTKPSVERTPLLREASLPNGISTTKVISSQSPLATEDEKQVPTLGHLFAPPASLAPLHPPKQPKHSSTKGSSVNWHNPADSEKSVRSSRRGSYPVQPLSTGQWLSYNHRLPASPPPSPDARRKQRDRGLSTSEAKHLITRETSVAQQEASDESLFRRNYSSFGPSRDNAAAVVPDDTKNRIWWNTVGEKRFQRKFARAEGLRISEHPQSTSIISPRRPDEDADLHEAVTSYVPQDVPPELVPEKIDGERANDKEIEQVLADISELLETLNSYRRIRNLSLTANARSSISQRSPLVALTGSPTSPSSAEFSVYEMIKSQLSILIASLPPYAVAKLNGQQLEELSISTAIPVEAKDYRGVMDEDETAAKVKATALTTTPGRVSTPALASQSSHGQYQAPQSALNHYPQRMGHMPQASASKSQPTMQYQTYQGPNGSKSSNGGQRASVSTAQSYPGPHTPSSNAQQSTYTQGYTHQNSRPSLSHYGQSSPPQYLQQPHQTSQSSHYDQQYHQSRVESTPHAQIQNRQYQQPSQPKYQQRAQTFTRDASLNPTPGVPATARSASPQRISSYTSQQSQPLAQSLSQSQPTQQRSSLSTTGQGTSRQYFQQSNLGSQPSPQPQYQGPSTPGASGFHTYLTAPEQAAMMERQRARLAQQNEQSQQQAKVAAQVNMLRQSSGTPQPLNGKSGYSSQINGSMQSKPNGDTPLVAGIGP
ncbi:MAG: hypothetical protein M1835_001094 [Candelina submexicana]|nr:MAG: hypothetical protein M1835_001094 [Candelina submexicana]